MRRAEKAARHSLDEMKVGLMRKQLRGRDMLKCDRVMRRIRDDGIAVSIVMDGGEQRIHA